MQEVDQQYPPVISTHAELSHPHLDPCRATHSRNQRRVAPRCRRLFNTRPCWQPCWHNVVPKICETMGGDRSSQARKSREHPCSQRHLMTGHLNIWQEQEKKKRQQCGTETKNLTLRAWLPTILPCKAVPEAWVQLEPLKGQRGSFGRQPSLAPPPRGVSSWCDVL